MIKVTLTETYGGFNITGEYQDFQKLKESFNYFFDENVALKEKNMQNRILKFVKAMDNLYQDKHNDEYSFKYCLPELIGDIIIFKYFVTKKENNDIFNEEYHEVFLFFSKIIASLKVMVSKRKYAQIYDLILKGHIEPETYLKQWLDKLVIKYLSMSQGARQDRLAKVVEGICDWQNFSQESYENTYEQVKNYCIEHNCQEEEVVLEEYPQEIDW